MLDIQGIMGPAGSVFHNDLHVIVCFGTDYALLTVVIIIVQMSCKYKFPTLTKVTVVLAAINLLSSTAVGPTPTYMRLTTSS